MSSQLTRTRLSSTLEHSALVFKERAVLTKTSAALPGSIVDPDAADGENHGSHEKLIMIMVFLITRVKGRKSGRMKLDQNLVSDECKFSFVLF